MLFPALRRKAVRQLVHVIIDGPGGYRTARELEAFFANLGHASALLKNESRIEYATRVIEDAQKRGQSELLLQAVVQAEVSEEASASLLRLISEIFSPYGWTVVQAPESGIRLQPLVIQAAPLTPDVLDTPEFQLVFLADDEVTLLQDRWAEAVVLHHAGASRMALIALSAIVEHVLLGCVQAYPRLARASPEAQITLVRFGIGDSTCSWPWPTNAGGSPSPKLTSRIGCGTTATTSTPAHELREGGYLDDVLISDTWRNVKQTLEELYERTRSMPPTVTRAHGTKAFLRAQRAAYQK
ncbi:hypothetical protein CTI14_01800 [Methylobacterium radiotolerans]|nr:hypothetical protein CTI14_01800 [Methylobacterium radiotolerans]